MRRWINLSEIPSESQEYSNIIALNAQALLIANDSGGIYKYTTTADRWQLLVAYPVDTVSIYIQSAPKLAVNHDKTQLYILSRKSCSCLDLKTMQYSISELWSPYYHDEQNFCSSSCIVVDSQLHMIGGEYCSNHKIYNIDHINECIYKCSLWENAVESPKLIYLQSHRKLFVFGGMDADRDGNSDCSEAGVYGECEQSLDEIWCYTFDNKQWALLDVKIPHPMHGFGIASTSDERYVLFIGGEYWFDDYESQNGLGYNSIYILDITNMTFSQSSLKVPDSHKGGFEACIVSNQSTNINVINGFIRNIVVLPFEIKDVISRFCGNEYLHIMQGSKHWKIEVDDIFHETHQC